MKILKSGFYNKASMENTWLNKKNQTIAAKNISKRKKDIGYQFDNEIKQSDVFYPIGLDDLGHRF